MPDLKTRMLSKHQTNLNNNEKYFRCFYDILILLCIRFTDTKGKLMGLNSFLFVLFVVISLFIYYVIPKKLQWIWLLVISYVYYITNSRGLVVFIATTTLTTWYAGLTLEKTEENKKRRLIVALTLLFNFGILAVLKYTNFLIVNINDLFHTSILQFAWALPLGISFYTFQSMGYLLDICWKRTAAEKNLFRFALFVSFFPQILQGPIGRYSRLAHQLYEEHSFDLGRFERGFQRILWGFFKKMVIADNALYFVNPLFKEYQTYDGVALFATVFYAIQLYMDFSGGIDVVIGIADLFGVTMDENFRQPYFAVSITDFWHRWHITLGTWMKDYVFYPISLSKWMGRFGKWSKKTFGKQTGRALPICVANVIVFLIVGIWHGAAWKYIAYGLYNGFIIGLSGLLAPQYREMRKKLKITKDTRWFYVFQIVRTFVLVLISFFFDMGNGFKDALIMIRNCFTKFEPSQLLEIDVGTVAASFKAPTAILVIAIGCIIVFIVSVLKERGVDVAGRIRSANFAVRILVYVIILMLLPLVGQAPLSSGGFIYAQF